MRRRNEQKRESGTNWLRQYVVGLGLGLVSAVYGLIALVMRNSFLPGLKGGSHTVKGPHAVAVAIVYLAGGLFLVFRFFLDPRCRARHTRAEVYLAENVLLILLIAAAVYVLLSVGTAG
jgi:hypothetical protein